MLEVSVTLENETHVVNLTTMGAELLSFKDKQQEVEYIWQGDPTFWGRRAPVLFPIVGRLKNNSYTYEGKQYTMTQHGFARDEVFEVEEVNEDSVIFLLKSNPHTLSMYPFDFELRVGYQLCQHDLHVTYHVTSLSETLIFGIGGHPAFNVPLVEGCQYDDFYLNFNPLKSRLMIPLEGPFINLSEKTLGQTNTPIQIKRSLFENDAVILETSGKNSFTIASEKTDHSVTLSYHDFPYVGFWTPYDKEAPFVCIEPWCGIADTLDATGELTEKFGMNHLGHGEVFSRTYTISVN